MKTDKLIERAKYWINGNYSEAYIQSQMYAERDQNTSIEDIAKAIKEAKKPPKKRKQSLFDRANEFPINDFEL